MSPTLPPKLPVHTAPCVWQAAHLCGTSPAPRLPPSDVPPEPKGDPPAMAGAGAEAVRRTGASECVSDVLVRVLECTRVEFDGAFVDSDSLKRWQVRRQPQQRA